MAIDIEDVDRRVQYTGSGTGPYNFTFNVLAQTDIAVYQDDTLLTLTTDYSVTVNPDGTGSVTTVASMTGSTVTIIGARPYERTTDYAEGGDFTAETINEELDSIAILIQQLRESITRGMSISQTAVFSGSKVFPAPGAGEYLRWNVAGTALETVSAAPDAGVFQQSGTGAIERSWTAKVGETVSVKDFGAVGDGVTDDTAAIQAAIDYVGALGGGTVFFPQTPDYYKITAAISINYDNVTLRGENPYSTWIKQTSTEDVIRAYVGDYGPYPAAIGTTTIIKNVCVIGLGIDGNQSVITHAPTDSYCNGININFGQNCLVQNCVVKNAVFQGIVFQGSGDATSYNNRAINNVVSACGEIGIGLEGGTYDSLIQGNIVHDMATVAEVSGGGIGILVSQISQTGLGNKVSGNLVYNIPASGIVVQDGSAYTQVEGNTVYNAGTTLGSAIAVNADTTSPNHVAITNNVIASGCYKTTYAIEVLNTSSSVGFATVSGNKISDCEGGGIRVNDGKNCAVTANHIHSVGNGSGATATNGITIEGSANPTCTGNTVSSAIGTGINVGSSTTSAVVQSNNVYSNGTNYADAGTGTIVDQPLTYTPTWTASGGNPSIGDGSITGSYVTSGKQVNVTIKLTMGSTTTFGTGTYQFSLPFTAVSGQEFIGGIHMLDSGTTNYIGACRIASGASIMDGFVDNSAAQIGPTVPHTWAQNDTITLTCSYTRA